MSEIWFFKKNSKTDKLFAIRTKGKRKKPQNASVRSEGGTVGINITGTKRVTKKPHEQPWPLNERN